MTSQGRPPQFVRVSGSRRLAGVQPVYRQLGRAIRETRQAKGLTQDQVADLAGLNRSHVGEIERGEANVTIQTLKTLADTLGVTVSDFVRGL